MAILSLKKVLNRSAILLGIGIFLTGCLSTTPPKEYDYSAFKASDPHSILVLPPINNTPEPLASDAILSAVSYPIAESGYYVVPVSLVRETLRQNGVLTPDDAQQISRKKLHQIFGADAILYLTVTSYGTSYQVINSETRVAINGELVDARTGAKLWDGARTISESSNDGNNSAIGALLSAVVSQIGATVSDYSYEVGQKTSRTLLSAGYRDNILHGPYSPHYWKEKPFDEK